MGTTTRVPRGFAEFGDLMINNLKQNFPYVTLSVFVFLDLGMLIHSSVVTTSKGQMNSSRSSEGLEEDQKFLHQKSGYDAYFGLSSTALAQNSEFEVDDDATKAKIKSAFAKSLKTKN